MSTLDHLLQRNQDFAARQSAAGTLMPSLPRAMPKVKALISGCADMRVDPTHVLGIKPGEAVVLRNIGGRFTPGLLEQMALLHRIGQVAEAAPGGGAAFHLIVLQHQLRHHSPGRRLRHAGTLFSTPGRLTQEQSGQRSSRGRCRRRCCAPRDSRVAVLPDVWLISDLVYDVATGLAEVVVPPAPIRAA